MAGKRLDPLKRAESPGDASMILAGKTLFVGGKDKVTAIDVHDGKAVWSAEIAGTAKGLAASGGRLFVSTDSGTIHAFSAEAGASGAEVAEEVVENPYPDTPDGAGAPCAQTARKILDAAGPKGYALVSDLEGDGSTWRAKPSVATTPDEVLSAAGSAFLLFGMALLYAEAGSLEFIGIGLSLGTFGSATFAGTRA